MMMTTDLNETDAGYMTDAEHEETKASLRAEIVRAKDTFSIPVLPSADDYRDGMNKMRAKINCPVLSADEQAIADELREFDATAQAHDDLPPVDRLNVAEYLKEQYQTNMLARYPNFEATTENDIAMLKLKMDQMFVFNTVIAMFLGVLLVLGFWLIFLMV